MHDPVLLCNMIPCTNMDMTTETIFQLTDLAQRRTEFVEAARRGGARLRDKDGTSLVMLPESRVLVLEGLSLWNSAYLRLEQLIRRGETPTVSDFGELAWLRAFDSDDLNEFVSDLHDALVAARADDNLEVIEALVHEWRVTAAQLSDPLRRSILTGTMDPDRDLATAHRPNG